MNEKREIITKTLPLLLNPNTRQQAYEKIIATMKEMGESIHSKEDVIFYTNMIKGLTNVAQQNNLPFLLENREEWLKVGGEKMIEHFDTGEIIKMQLSSYLSSNNKQQSYQAISNTMNRVISSAKNMEDLKKLAPLLKECVDFGKQHNIPNLLNDCQKWNEIAKQKLDQFQLERVNQGASITSQFPLLLNPNTKQQAYETIKTNMENMIANSNSREELNEVSVSLRQCCEFATNYDMKPLVSDCQKWISDARKKLSEVESKEIQQENSMQNSSDIKNNVISELEQVKTTINQMENGGDMDIDKVYSCRSRLGQIEMALESKQAKDTFSLQEINNHLAYIEQQKGKLNRYIQMMDVSLESGRSR